MKEISTIALELGGRVLLALSKENTPLAGHVTPLSDSAYRQYAVAKRGREAGSR